MNARFKSLFVQLQLPCPDCRKFQTSPNSNHRRRKSSCDSDHAGKNIRIVTELTVPPAKISSVRIEQRPRYYASGEFTWKDLDSFDALDDAATGGVHPVSSDTKQGIVVPLTPAVETPLSHPGDPLDTPDSAIPLEEFGVRRGQIPSECSSESSSPVSAFNSSVHSSPIDVRHNRPQPGSPQLFSRVVQRPLAGRGVLLDWRWHALCRGIEYSPFEMYSITLEELKAIAAYSNIEFAPGDILLIRTGWTAEFVTLTDLQKDVLYKSEVGACCGVESGDAAEEWHRSMGFSAVVTDSRKYEAWPPPLPPGRPLSEVLCSKRLYSILPNQNTGSSNSKDSNRRRLGS